MKGKSLLNVKYLNLAVQKRTSIAIANLHLQCIQDPYCRQLRPQHVGLKLRFSSLVSVGRLLAMLGRPARLGGGD